MKKQYIRKMLPLAVIITVFIIPASASLNKIPAGGTVFIGEQNLDLTANITSGTEIGYWSSVGSPFITSPSYLLTINDASHFNIDPTTFGQRTGVWYKTTDRSPAFYIEDPSLSLRIFDITVDSDRTGTWIPWGDEVKFRIDTNLYSISQRGVGAPITIKVQNPSGSVYSSLINKSKSSTSLEISVDSSSYYTVPIWDTGNSTYPAGVYTIWAECNANNMKDNYNVVGKTTTSSDSGQVKVQDVNPAINTAIPTTTLSTPNQTTAAVTISNTPVPTTLIVTTALPSVTQVSPTIVHTTGTSLENTSPPITAPTRAAGFGTVLAIHSLLGLCAIVIYGRRRS